MKLFLVLLLTYCTVVTRTGGLFRCNRHISCRRNCWFCDCSSQCTCTTCLMPEAITITVSVTVCPTKATQVLATTSQTPAITTAVSFMSPVTPTTTMPGSTVTTQPQSLTPASLTTGLTASTGVLVALLTGTILGWVSTCVYWRYWYKHFTKQQEVTDNSRSLHNAVYDPEVPHPPQAITNYSSLGHAYELVEPIEGSYDIINRGGAMMPRLHTTPPESHDQEYSTLDNTRVDHDYQILEAGEVELTNQNSQSITENDVNVEITIEDSGSHDDDTSDQIDSGLVGTQDCDIESEDADKMYDNLKH
ncbi:uncharacterized protein LOC135344209 [Halichondria panicea]|uniref:uncharacterized protein LOC135344209 n=1 Tax=Halichondria panicea TaxID=6063 RepID=UPI00312B3B56